MQKGASVASLLCEQVTMVSLVISTCCLMYTYNLAQQNKFMNKTNMSLCITGSRLCIVCEDWPDAAPTLCCYVATYDKTGFATERP